MEVILRTASCRDKALSSRTYLPSILGKAPKYADGAYRTGMASEPTMTAGCLRILVTSPRHPESRPSALRHFFQKDVKERFRRFPFLGIGYLLQSFSARFLFFYRRRSEFPSHPILHQVGPAWNALDEVLLNPLAVLFAVQSFQEFPDPPS